MIFYIYEHTHYFHIYKSILLRGPMRKTRVMFKVKTQSWNGKGTYRRFCSLNWIYSIWYFGPSYKLSAANFCSRVAWEASKFLLFLLSFWRNTEQDLFNIFGSMYIALIFLGLNNCSTVLPYVATERTVLYREKFAGMYSPRAYSFAQVWQCY